MRKRKSVIILFFLLLLFAMPATSRAATKPVYRLNGVAIPNVVRLGSFFNVRGQISCNVKLTQVRVSIYNEARTKRLQLYTLKPNAKVCDLEQADAHIIFDKLGVGNYYYRIWCRTSTGVSRYLVSRKFSVIGTGSIRIANPVPSKDISIKEGSSYALGGTITSTYKLAGITAAIVNSNNRVIYSSTVRPGTKTYHIANSTLDSNLFFDKLDAGTYKYRLTAADIQGKTVTLVYRTVTVKSSGNTVTPGSSGGNNGNTGKYLNTTETVTTPANFIRRVSRPGKNNKYYYNKNYNLYYAYDSLAPTGKAMYGGSYVTGNCTWYACGRALEIVATAGGDINKVKAIFGGDPVGIYKANLSKGKFKYGTTPKIGALAVFNYGYGGDAHIAVVEDVKNGVPYVSESGYTVSTTAVKADKSNIVFKYQSIYNWAGGRSLLGYIYLLD